MNFMMISTFIKEDIVRDTGMVMEKLLKTTAANI